MHRIQQPFQVHFFDFWLARGAIALTAILNALLINNVSSLPWWLASFTELALLVPLSVATARTHARIRKATSEHHWIAIHHHRRIIRRVEIFITAFITVINTLALFTVLHALLQGAKGTTGQSILIDALNIWFTNVVVFALWFWNLDRGGPAIRAYKSERSPDFLFPQMTGNITGSEKWVPGFIDYFFVSFTNATAFSPTDTMPLSPRSKLLFIIQASASLLTVGLVAARAVNVIS
jgi:hypothetical protein